MAPEHLSTVALRAKDHGASAWQQRYLRPLLESASQVARVRGQWWRWARKRILAEQERQLLRHLDWFDAHAIGECGELETAFAPDEIECWLELLDLAEVAVRVAVLHELLAQGRKLVQRRECLDVLRGEARARLPS